MNDEADWFIISLAIAVGFSFALCMLSLIL